ncbi:hypothetical protein DFP73DRAFT_539722 [Morchella snyderi]|nr:hypothetical protein DFP73DRAFT_539722 [Morchella snyderi]
MDATQNENFTNAGKRKFPAATLTTSLDLPIPKEKPTVCPSYIVGSKRRRAAPAPPPPTFKKGEVATSEVIGACTSIIPTTLGCWKKVANVYNIGCEAFDYTPQDGKALRDHFGNIIKTASCNKPGCQAINLAWRSGVVWDFKTADTEEVPLTPYSSWMKKKLEYSTANKTDTTAATSMPIPPSSNSKGKNPNLPASIPVATEDRPDNEAGIIAQLREEIYDLRSRLCVSEGKKDLLQRGNRMLERHNAFVSDKSKELYKKISKLEGVITDLEGTKKTVDPSRNEQILHPTKRNKKAVDIAKNKKLLQLLKGHMPEFDPPDHLIRG